MSKLPKDVSLWPSNEFYECLGFQDGCEQSGDFIEVYGKDDACVTVASGDIEYPTDPSNIVICRYNSDGDLTTIEINNQGDAAELVKGVILAAVQSIV